MKQNAELVCLNLLKCPAKYYRSHNNDNDKVKSDIVLNIVKLGALRLQTKHAICCVGALKCQQRLKKLFLLDNQLF